MPSCLLLVDATDCECIAEQEVQCLISKNLVCRTPAAHMGQDPAATPIASNLVTAKKELRQAADPCPQEQVAKCRSVCRATVTAAVHSAAAAHQQFPFKALFPLSYALFRSHQSRDAKSNAHALFDAALVQACVGHKAM